MEKQVLASFDHRRGMKAEKCRQTPHKFAANQKFVFESLVISYQ